MKEQDMDKNKVWPPTPAQQSDPNEMDQSLIKPKQVTTAKSLREARLFGAFVFVMCLGFTLWMKSIYASQGSISGKVVIGIPAGLLGGLAFMIEPRILLANVKGAPPQPAIFKILGYAVGAIGVGIGFYILFTFFK